MTTLTYIAEPALAVPAKRAVAEWNKALGGIIQFLPSTSSKMPDILIRFGNTPKGVDAALRRVDDTYDMVLNHNRTWSSSWRDKLLNILDTSCYARATIRTMLSQIVRDKCLIERSDG